MSWTGWLWCRGRWQRVCQADSLGACSGLLLDQAEARGIRRSRYRGMTSGAVPGWNPSQKAPASAGPEPQGPAEPDDL